MYFTVTTYHYNDKNGEYYMIDSSNTPFKISLSGTSEEDDDVNT